MKFEDDVIVDLWGLIIDEKVGKEENEGVVRGKKRLVFLIELACRNGKVAASVGYHDYFKIWLALAVYEFLPFRDHIVNKFTTQPWYRLHTQPAYSDSAVLIPRLFDEGNQGHSKNISLTVKKKIPISQIQAVETLLPWVKPLQRSRTSPPFDRQSEDV